MEIATLNRMITRMPPTIVHVYCFAMGPPYRRELSGVRSILSGPPVRSNVPASGGDDAILKYNMWYDFNDQCQLKGCKI